MSVKNGICHILRRRLKNRVLRTIKQIYAIFAFIFPELYI